MTQRCSILSLKPAIASRFRSHIKSVWMNSICKVLRFSAFCLKPYILGAVRDLHRLGVHDGRIFRVRYKAQTQRLLSVNRCAASACSRGQFCEDAVFYIKRFSLAQRTINDPGLFCVSPQMRCRIRWGLLWGNIFKAWPREPPRGMTQDR